MCGILATITAPGAPSLRPSVERGLAALDHRGPDARGVRDMHARTAACVLGLTRLRIIDVSPGADQPIDNEDGSVAVSYNGELYNYAELRVDLQRAGHVFRTRTDTEVIVHLYEECDGNVDRCLTRLRGMFAFVLFDSGRGRLVAARDRLGIKPLYFAEVPRGIALGSEVRSLVATGLVDATPDREAIAEFLGCGVVRAPRTIVAGIRSLMPGTYGTWQEGVWLVQHWWRPEFTAEPHVRHEEDATQLMAAALDDSVARHLVADRPVGLFLSGGIDSGAVAALAARNTHGIRALTVTFPEHQVADEHEAATATARRWGLTHLTVPITGREIVDVLPTLWRAMDQPTWDGVNSWVVCRAAREAGLVVCLSGIGGDELFGGYPSFRVAPRLARLLGALTPLPVYARDALARRLSHRAPGSPWVRAMAAPPTIAGAYGALRGLLAPVEVREWLDATVNVPRPDDEFADSADPRDSVGLLELTRYLPDQLLRDTDSVSMSHSLEVRVPLLDDTVVRVALATPAALRCAPRKRFLTAAAGFEPTEGKQPFTLPFELWSRQMLREQLREGVLSDALPFGRELRAAARRQLWTAFEAGRVHWSRPWAITALRQWPVANGLSW